jgi:hypothetical protein
VNGNSAPEELVFEHFLPWIQKIMLAYEIRSTDETDPFPPKGTMFSKGYYTKNVN